MLRITKQTDYGIMLLARLSEQPAGVYTSARDAAEWSGLSMAMVSKILKLLTRGGLVTSHRGALGGYLLARPASEITDALLR